MLQSNKPTVLKDAALVSKYHMRTRSVKKLTWVAGDSHNRRSLGLEPLVEFPHEQHVAQLALALHGGWCTESG